MLHRVTNICYFQVSIQFVLLLLRPEPPEPKKAETTPYLFKQQDETGAKDEMRKVLEVFI
jgi:hypothetical protein